MANYGLRIRKISNQDVCRDASSARLIISRRNRGIRGQEDKRIRGEEGIEGVGGIEGVETGRIKYRDRVQGNTEKCGLCEPCAQCGQDEKRIRGEEERTKV